MFLIEQSGDVLKLLVIEQSGEVLNMLKYLT